MKLNFKLALFLPIFFALSLSAEKNWESCLAQEPDNQTFQYNCANSLYDQGRFEDAEKYYKKVLNAHLDEDQKEQGNFNLGCSQAKQKKYDEAIKSFEEVEKINPHNERASKNIDILKKLREEQQKRQQQEQQSSDGKQDKKEDSRQDHGEQNDKGQQGQKQELKDDKREQPQNKPEHKDPSKTAEQEEQQSQHDADKNGSKDDCSSKEGEKEGSKSKGDDREQDSGEEAGASPDDKGTNEDKDKTGQQSQHDSSNNDSDLNEDQDMSDEEKEQPSQGVGEEEQDDPLSDAEKDIAAAVDKQCEDVGKYKMAMLRRDDYGW